MAEKITDRELVDELQLYGETVTLPLKLGKRGLLIKKLNHFRSKAKAANRPASKTGKRAHLDVLSSDDSDFENAGQSDRNRSKIVSGVSKSIRRRSTANAPISPAKPKADSKRLSLGRPTLRSRKSDYTQASDSPGRVTKLDERRSTSRLYPDLRDLDTSRSHGNMFGQNDTFESSDSDLDESTYEVENKSVNTTFTIESNNSFLENKSPGYRSRKSNSNTPYSNHVTPNREVNSSRYSTNNTQAKQVNDTKKQYRMYPEHVSGGLLVIVGGFFLILAVSYLFVRRDVIVSWYNGTGDITKPAQKTTYLMCSGDNQQDCYPEKVVLKTMIVIHDVFEVLSSKKGAVICGTAEDWEKNMSIDQFDKYVKSKNKDHRGDINELVNSCLDHILKNPQWNIRALNSAGLEAVERGEIQHLESAVASMGMMCRLQRSFFKVTGIIMILILGGLLVFLLLKYLQWRNVAKEKELRHVYSMVDEIIDILKRHHDITQDESNGHNQYLAVQHVRDQLLPPSRRKELQPIWEKAVQFIEKNESRIRLEEQTIEGEDFRVWRWIHNSPNGGKVWQGQAFGEHSDDNSNTVMICPTPCLKIRNMFDADVEGEEGDWEVNIEDALLEKCKNIKSIYHIYVDKDSKEGCVYMKCSSCEAAGRARQSLHGWWFDRRLVTVRYLKLDYYHNRFPESVSQTTPLLPSTNQMSSLSQPFYRSSLEMT